MDTKKKALLLTKLDDIISELKRLGLWDIPESNEDFIGQLRHGMIPGIQAGLKGDYPLPDESNLGALAAREIGDEPKFNDLYIALQNFDTVYNAEKAE